MKNRFGKMLLLAGALAEAADLYQSALRATVRVTAGPTSGTAFVVNVDGKDDHLLVTAAHVFKDMPGETCTVVFRRSKGEGRFERHEARCDQ